MDIRLENEKDYLKVENLVRDSFWNIYRPGAYEHYIVHKLRNHPSFIRDLAYVIEKDGEIIGHINYSKGQIDYDDGKSKEAIVLGPVSIDKKYQNQGYGTKLIEYTLKLLNDKNVPFVFVIGDENYYCRFGFESASKYNLHLAGCDLNEECPFFMIKIYNMDEITLKKGIFSNPDVFDIDEDDVDELDKKFEFRKKEVNDNQLEV